MTTSIQTLPRSKYFTLQRLTDGVFVALSVPGTGSWANAGIIDLGDDCLIFDTFATPSAADELRQAAEELTGKRASMIINSHNHLDHVNGNQVFKGAAIISTNQTRDQIAIRLPRFLDIVRKNPDHLGKMKKEIENEKNPLKRDETEMLLGEYTAIEKDLEMSKLTLPTITFEEEMRFYGTRRSAVLLTYGGGHSISDSFLYLPEDGVLFLADLMHIGYHADFRQGNLDNWLKILERIKTLDVKYIVSGHGTVGTKNDLINMQNYLQDIKILALDWLQNGGNAENSHEIGIPEQYAHYQVPSVFYGNLKFLLSQPIIKD